MACPTLGFTGPGPVKDILSYFIFKLKVREKIMQLLSSGLAKPNNVMRHRPVVQGDTPERSSEGVTPVGGSGRQGRAASGEAGVAVAKQAKANSRQKRKQQPFLTAGPKCHWAAKQLSPKRELSEAAWELAARQPWGRRRSVLAGTLVVGGAHCAGQPWSRWSSAHAGALVSRRSSLHAGCLVRLVVWESWPGDPSSKRRWRVTRLRLSVCLNRFIWTNVIVLILIAPVQLEEG